MTNDKRNRVFWLGQHVVLTKTELPQLRALGYEVFNPPYLADVYDQSAVMQWDRSQTTTLPPEVFHELSQYNFFYNRISPRVAELLNEHFGTVIVTSNPVWLHSILAAFRGRIIYRVFGQASLESDTLCNMQLFRSIQEHDDFHFVPHAEEAVSDDHAWLRTRMTVVPYTIPLDVFEHEGTWSPRDPNDQEIMTCCPNIENPYYVQQYRYLNAHFPEACIRLYGVQPRRHADTRVVGTLAREELLNCYRRSAGYWYHYDQPYLCYLPPIEMMTVGGPVVYMRGSLLARYFQSPGPGEAANAEDAKRKISLLLAGDRAFVNDVRAAQAPIVRRYHPDYVQPIFDRAFRRLIDRPDVPRQEPLILRAGEPRSSRKRAYVFFHAPGKHVTLQGGVYRGADDLGRTVATVAGTLLEDTDHEVVVTCFADQLPFLFGLLSADKYPGRLRFYVLDHERLAPIAYKKLNAWLRPFRIQPVAEPPQQQPAGATPASGPTTCVRPPTNWRSRLDRRCWDLALASLALVARSRIAMRVLVIAAIAAVQLFRGARQARAWLAALKAQARARIVARKAQALALLGPYWRAIKSPNASIRRRDCVDQLNREDEETVVIVPHGHAFPEALFLTRPMVLCLPDVASDDAPTATFRGKVKAHIARCLTDKATSVLAASEVSQSCLFAAQRPIGSPRRGVSVPCPAEILPHKVASKPHSIALVSDLQKGVGSWNER